MRTISTTLSFPLGFPVAAAFALAFASVSAIAQLPTVEVVTPDSPARPGKPYEVNIAVTWDGPSNAYVIGPPEIPDFDWGKVTAKSASGGRTASESGAIAQSITQTLEIVADKEGSYDVAALAVPYIDPAQPPMPAEEDAEPPEPPTLAVPTFSVEVKKGFSPLLYLGPAAVVLLVGVAAIVALYRSRRGATVPPSTAPATAAAARDALHAAKKHRLDGDYYAFFTALCLGARAFRTSEAGTTLHAKLEDWANRAGYGGAQPTQEDLDGLQRDYERMLHEMEAADAAAGDAVSN